MVGSFDQVNFIESRIKIVSAMTLQKKPPKANS